jgi:hypothetical protein
MAKFVEDAFDAVCKEAKTAEVWYVCLMVNVSYYGGPEEGGWWGNDSRVVKYQAFSSEEAAEAAEQAVEKLARELTEQDRNEYGRKCLAEMEWLDARGLDSDFLPEPDGPDEYYVIVSKGVPEDHNGCRHYE